MSEVLEVGAKVRLCQRNPTKEECLSRVDRSPDTFTLHAFRTIPLDVLRPSGWTPRGGAVAELLEQAKQRSHGKVLHGSVLL